MKSQFAGPPRAGTRGQRRKRKNKHRVKIALHYLHARSRVFEASVSLNPGSECPMPNKDRDYDCIPGIGAAADRPMSNDQVSARYSGNSSGKSIIIDI